MAASSETNSLRRFLHDLATFSSLNSLWNRRTPQTVAQSLCDLLLHTLKLDPVYLRLSGSTGEPAGEKFASRNGAGKQWSRALRRTAGQEGKTARAVQPVSIVAQGKAVRGIVLPIGVKGEEGVIVAGAPRPDFPSKMERLLLTICATQVAMVLQKSRLTGVSNDRNRLRHSLLELEQKARREAEAREERFRLLVGAVREYAIILLDPEGRVSEWNSGAERLFCYSEREILGRHFSRFYPRKDRAKIARSRLLKARSARGVAEEEEWQVRKDGTLFLASIVLTPLRDPGGAVRGFSEVVRDITSRRIAQEALRRSEEGFRKVFEESPVGMVLIGADSRIARANEAFSRMIGYSRRDLKTRRFVDLVFREDAALDERETRRLYRGKISRFQVEQRLLTRRMEVIWGLITISLIHDERGEILYKLAIVENITARKRAEERIAFQASLLDHVCNAVIATNLSGRIIFWNAHAESLYQWKAREVMGRKLIDVLIPGSRAREVRQVMRLVEANGCWEGEFTVRRKDGSTFQAYVVDATITDEKKKPYGIVGVSFDITERKRSEEQIRNSQEQLRALTAHVHWVRERERAHIAREIHDELGQALTGLKIDLSWLDHRIREATPPPTQPKLLSKIESMSDLLDSTVRQVRKIATELRPRILDELGLLAAIEWQAHEFQARTGIECRFQANAERIEIDDDRATAIFRIFQETLTNILRHAKGSRVDVKLEQTGNELTLEVQDNGRGIARNKIHDSRSLGLLGMRERALLSRGELSIQGARGKGTTVTVWLPLRSPAANGVKNSDSPAGELLRLPPKSKSRSHD